jgi:DNA-binding beta-propeller fold protein YncE
MTLAGGLPLDSTRSVSTLGGGYEGSSLSQLNTPADVFVYGDLGVFVADMGNHRVLHFPPGSYSGIHASVVLENDKDAENLYPAAVQVVDMVAMQAPTTEWLQVLSGSQSRSLRVDFLTRPPAPMTVRPPVMLIDQETSAQGLNAPEAAQLFEGSLYVVDTGNHRIRMFVLPSLVVHTIAGGWGPGEALHQLNSPRHFAMRSQLMPKKVLIYIADTLNHRVVVSEQPVDFTQERKKIPAKVVAGGNGPGTSSSQLFEPSGIFITADGKFVFVADSGNSRVQKWEIGGVAGITAAGGVQSGASATQFAYPRRVQVIEHEILRANTPRTISTLVVVDSGNHRVQRLPPLLATASTCTLGRPCELALSVNRPDVTLRIVKGDIVRIVPLSFDTWCGAGHKNSSQPSNRPQCGNPAEWNGIANPNRLTKMRGTAVQTASHHFPAATEGPVGEFRICWGSDVPDVAINDCESTPIDVGILVMQGPLPGQVAQCTLGVGCGVDLQGVGLQIGNRLALRYIGGSVNGTEDCDFYRTNVTQNIWNRVDHWEWPIENIVPYASAFGSVKNGAHFSYTEGHRGPVGNQYMLCWTEGWPLGIPPDSKVLVYADHGLEYRVRVGSLTMLGPHQGINTTCWLNEVCSMTLPGLGLLRSNGIRLVMQDDDPNAAPCNDFMPVPVASAKVVGLTNPVPASQVDPNGESVSFVLGTALDDDNLGNYTICWGHAYDEDPSHVETYNIQVGIWALYERPYELRKRRNTTEPVATSGCMARQMVMPTWLAIVLACMLLPCA